MTEVRAIKLLDHDFDLIRIVIRAHGVAQPTAGVALGIDDVKVGQPAPQDEIAGAGLASRRTGPDAVAHIVRIHLGGTGSQDLYAHAVFHRLAREDELLGQNWRSVVGNIGNVAGLSGWSGDGGDGPHVHDAEPLSGSVGGLALHV